MLIVHLYNPGHISTETTRIIYFPDNEYPNFPENSLI